MSTASPKPDDLKGIGFPDVNWDGAHDSQTLETLRKFVVQQAEEASQWYVFHRKWKRFSGRTIRLLAMLATTAAGIIPILSQICTYNGQPCIPPGWASVALALAAGLIGLDYFFGFSSAWMRYMETQQKIVYALREFQFDWETLRAAWGATPPGAAQVLGALARLKQTCLLVQQLVEEETGTWMAEFRTNLRMLDEAARAKIEVAALPGMNVIVTNGPQTADGWFLSVDDGAPKGRHGDRAALVGLAPGAHKLRAEGTIGDKALHDEVTVNVPATGVGEATLTLK